MEIHSIRLQRLQGRLGEIVYELTRTQFRQLPQSNAWTPAINAYRCRSHIVICVELAGVDKRAIEIGAELRRVRVLGRREPPEPSGSQHETVQVLAMEIDYGRFERELHLPVDIDPNRVEAEQRNGLLWIYLPLQAQC